MMDYMISNMKLPLDCKLDVAFWFWTWSTQSENQINSTLFQLVTSGVQLIPVLHCFVWRANGNCEISAIPSPGLPIICPVLFVWCHFTRQTKCHVDSYHDHPFISASSLQSRQLTDQAQAPFHVYERHLRLYKRCSNHLTNRFIDFWVRLQNRLHKRNGV